MRLTPSDRRGLRTLRRSEWLWVGFFIHAALIGLWRTDGSLSASTILLIIPISLIAVAYLDSTSFGRGWSMVRDWAPAALLVVAYWSSDWVARLPVDRRMQNALIRWDRMILNTWGLQHAIERFGALIPALLELSYLLVYAVLPIAIAGFHVRRERDRLEAFLFPFLLGTLACYALLPHVPVEGPRFAFGSSAAPVLDTVFRRFNLWILEHADIRSSVFPSGHVAVVFSAAFAVRLASPQRRRLFAGLLVLALLVWINTVYGRYHYAADGLASLTITAATSSAILAFRAFRYRGSGPNHSPWQRTSAHPVR